MAEIQIDMPELFKAVEAARERGVKTGPVMNVIAEDFVSRVNEEYETAGRGRWKDLADSTKKKRRGGTFQILVDSGRTAGSTKPEHGDDFAEAASDVETLVFHVSDQPRTKIPLRNPFDIPDEAFDEAAQTILDFVTGD
jgi:phage gpG-like protein